MFGSWFDLVCTCFCLGFQATNDTMPAMHTVNSTLGVFLFNLTADPTETNNLATARPGVLADMLETYSQYAATATMPLTFRYGFKDPHAGNSLPRTGEARCQGQFGGSPYCSFGHEAGCMVKGRAIHGAGTGGDPAARNGTACHRACGSPSTTTQISASRTIRSCSGWRARAAARERRRPKR